jgi:hypothetical protein
MTITPSKSPDFRNAYGSPKIPAPMKEMKMFETSRTLSQSNFSMFERFFFGPSIDLKTDQERFFLAN